MLRLSAQEHRPAERGDGVGRATKNSEGRSAPRLSVLRPAHQNNLVPYAPGRTPFYYGYPASVGDGRTFQSAHTMA
jgi:hypothetical protein